MADTLLESQVQNLADAMGVIRAAGAGTDYLPPEYASQLHSVIAANWQ